MEKSLEKSFRKTLLIKRRQITEQGIYHLTHRAPGKEVLFIENKDYLRFLFLLKEIPSRYQIKIIAFSLMHNHLHLLLKIEKTNLSQAMKELFQSYAIYFNQKYQRKGHVFSGRYAAAYCSNDDYLLAASVYIHLNAYKAKIVNNPFSYRWHSLGVYTRKEVNSFVYPNEVLELLDEKDNFNAKRLYTKIIKDSCNLKWYRLLEDNLALRRFNLEILKVIYKISGQQNRLSKFLSDKFELGKKADYFKANKEEKRLDTKRALHYLITQLVSRGYTFSEISQMLNRNRATIYKIYQKYK